MNLFYVLLSTTQRTCLSGVKSKDTPSKCTSWMEAISNRKIYQIWFFFRFSVFTNFLILSFLRFIYTCFRNENCLRQLRALINYVVHFPCTSYALFNVVCSTLLYVIRSDTIKSISGES